VNKPNYMQDEYLASLKGSDIMVRTIDSIKIKGKLLDYDIYCLKIQQEGGVVGVLYKRNIVSVSNVGFEPEHVTSSESQLLNE